MYLKIWQKYILIGVISGIIIFILLCPIYPPNPIKNETMFSSIVGWKFNDGSIFAALITSIVTILMTHYNVDKSHKSLKLSLLPEDSVSLLIDLKYKFDKYESYKVNKDKFILLLEILKCWKDYQKAFKLLAPKFYNNFLRMNNSLLRENTIKLENNDEKHHEELNDKNKVSVSEIEKVTSKEIFDNEETKTKKNYSDENCKYILKALMSQITNIAFENDNVYFEFIKPELITDDNIKNLGENPNNYTQIKITTPTLKNYINNIHGKETQKLTKNEFKKSHEKIKKLLDELKREIEEYD